MKEMLESEQAGCPVSGHISMNREDVIDLALLGVAVRLVALKPALIEIDFERLPSLRAFVDAGDGLISELGFGDDDP